MHADGPRAIRRRSHLRDLATTSEVSTRMLGAGLVSGVCEVIDPVGTVHESRVLGLEDEKRRFFSVIDVPSERLAFARHHEL